MSWQLARDEEDRVDALDIAGASVARGKPLGGVGDTAEAIFVERHCRRFDGRALLDLDERERLAAPRDQVDLAPGDPRALGEDAPAVQPQPPGGEVFGAAATRFGFGAAQRRSARASARA